MSRRVIESPKPEELAAFVTNGRQNGCLVTIYGTCTVEFTGHREGAIDSGDRVILCKTDGAISVHRPTGARAVARQGIGSSFEVFTEAETVVVYAAKGRNESIRIDITDAELAIQYAAVDDATLDKDQTEEQMHAFIQSNPGTLEEGLRIIEHERTTPHGRVDFYCADSTGTAVIVEVKQSAAEYGDVDQLQRYVSYFTTSEESTVRGMLVAPHIGDKVKSLLRSADLEWKEFERYDTTHTPPGQTSVGDW